MQQEVPLKSWNRASAGRGRTRGQRTLPNSSVAILHCWSCVCCSWGLNHKNTQLRVSPLKGKSFTLYFTYVQETLLTVIYF